MVRLPFLSTSITLSAFLFDRAPVISLPGVAVPAAASGPVPNGGTHSGRPRNWITGAVPLSALPRTWLAATLLQGRSGTLDKFQRIYRLVVDRE
jgi:hypothetical protein